MSKNRYFQKIDGKVTVIRPGSKQFGKNIQQVPKNVLTAIAYDYTWDLKDMHLAEEELRRRCNKKGEKPMQ